MSSKRKIEQEGITVKNKGGEGGFLAVPVRSTSRRKEGLEVEGRRRRRGRSFLWAATVFRKRGRRDGWRGKDHFDLFAGGKHSCFLAPLCTALRMLYSCQPLSLKRQVLRKHFLCTVRIDALNPWKEHSCLHSIELFKKSKPLCLGTQTNSFSILINL